jgi:hypothetical protein
MVVSGTASMPDRKISTLKAPANSDSDMIAHPRAPISGTCCSNTAWPI